jgi:hypothetical protein
MSAGANSTGALEDSRPRWISSRCFKICALSANRLTKPFLPSSDSRGDRADRAAGRRNGLSENAGSTGSRKSRTKGTQSRSKGSTSRWPAKAMGHGAAGANIEQALISPNQDSIEVSRVWRWMHGLATSHSCGLLPACRQSDPNCRVCGVVQSEDV